MDLPGPVFPATDRAREALRLDDQGEPVQSDQQVNLSRPDFEIREDDCRSSVVGQQPLDLAQSGAFGFVLHQVADADVQRRRRAAAHRAIPEFRPPTADARAPDREFSISLPTPTG